MVKAGHTLDLGDPQVLASLVRVALAKDKADLVIKGGSVYNVFTGEFSLREVAIYGDRIAGVGPIGSYKGRNELTVTGYLIPGFIDSHAHVESTMASPQALAPILLENGVTTAVVDPHEIANVAGQKGLDFFLEDIAAAAMDFFLTLPSCVPATNLEKGGAVLNSQDLAPYLNHPQVIALGEMMNYPGVINQDPEVLAKIALTHKALKRVDGHAPLVSGLPLVAYRAAGVLSDHEAGSAAEAQEKLANGFWLMIREGTAARNLKDLWPAITPRNARFCLFATDDRHAQDLATEGSVNHLVRLAQGLTPDLLPEILNMATLNPALFFGLRDRGAIAPGYLADFSWYPDLKSWFPHKVWKNGKLAVDGSALVTPKAPSDRKGDNDLLKTVKIAPLKPESLKVPATGSKVRVIGLTPGQLLTDCLTLSWPATNGFYESQVEADIIKIAIWNRYGGDGTAKVGFIKGLGLKKGALAQTISHDSHHLVAAGVTDADILLAAQTVIDLDGGLALVNEGKVLGSLALPLGGLMSFQPVRAIARALEKLDKIGRDLGLPPGVDPFLALGFMGLPVIPKLKLTVSGLIMDFKVVDLVLP
ncbi:MAG: adenine deaminase [Deltaproteobacteria bacterium]|jgi:adenine deaminase|nr:adenine deaminase [Deltaproteobacteria bacterium]